MLPLILALLTIQQSDTRIAVFVSPEIKNGFVSVDKGIQDSIKDVRAQLGKNRSVRLVSTFGDADLVLWINQRVDQSGTGGSVVVPASGMFFSVPVDKRGLYTTLQVGDYRHDITAIGDTWTACAKQIAADIDVWLKTNAAEIRRRKR